MAYFTMHSIFFLIIILPVVKCGSEPHCSKFHYEEKLLEKMIRMEIFVENMKTQVDDIQKKVEESLAKLKEETSTWKTEIKTIQENTAKLTKLNEEANSELEKNLHRVEELKGVYALKGKVVLPNVAFNAKNIKHRNPGSGNTIVFIETLLNLGESYNPDTGIFTALHGGTYIFTVQLCIQGSKYIDYGLVVDEVYMNMAWYAGSGSNNYRCYGSSTTVSVKSGNKVWVKVISQSGGNILHNSNSQYWNTFSGILIHAD